MAKRANCFSGVIFIQKSNLFHIIFDTRAQLTVGHRIQFAIVLTFLATELIFWYFDQSCALNVCVGGQLIITETNYLNK
jgi:hypothetical protein